MAVVFSLITWLHGTQILDHSFLLLFPFKFFFLRMKVNAGCFSINSGFTQETYLSSLYSANSSDATSRCWVEGGNV